MAEKSKKIKKRNLSTIARCDNCDLCVNCFITKTEVLFFLICALIEIVIFGREFSLSNLTFHFFIYSFIYSFMCTLLLWFTRGTVGRRSSYIVNDRGLRCFSVRMKRRSFSSPSHRRVSHTWLSLQLALTFRWRRSGAFD